MSCAVVLIAALFASAAPVPGTARNEGAAEKNRKALDRIVSVEFSDQVLSAVLNQLSEQTKLKFVLDRQAVAGMAGNDPEMPISVKLQEVKLRSALRTILAQYNLSYVVIDETVLVTTEEVAFVKQLRQRVRVACDETPLNTAIKQMVVETGANIVLDPRLPKEVKETALSLQLDEVPLDTAVRFMAEMAELKTVRVSNVLFVTTPEKAEKMKGEPEATAASATLPDEETKEVILKQGGARIAVRPAPVPVPAPPPPPAAAPAPQKAE
jgi:hypothetical protein